MADSADSKDATRADAAAEALRAACSRLDGDSGGGGGNVPDWLPLAFATGAVAAAIGFGGDTSLGGSLCSPFEAASTAAFLAVTSCRVSRSRRKACKRRSGERPST